MAGNNSFIQSIISFFQTFFYQLCGKPQAAPPPQSQAPPQPQAPAQSQARKEEFDTKPIAAELGDITLCAQKLWDLDNNRLEPEVDYGIDIQQGKRYYDNRDAAERKLFRGVSRAIWQRPTYRTFYALLDNYERQTGVEEVETEQERRENRAFIDAIMMTKPIQYCRNYLVAKGVASTDDLEFRRMLYNLWFQFYGREGKNDSSGFEHVFVGELDENGITGFHNWIQFFIEEAKGSVDYRGYIFPKKRTDPPTAHERLLPVQLAWDGEIKMVSTMFIGTSPEFEIALYTLYFLAGSERNKVELLNYHIEIVCYRIYGKKLGSCYPDLVRD